MKRASLVIVSGLYFLTRIMPCEAADFDKPQKELRAQIVIYNLLSGLYLTEEQMKFILEKAKEIESLEKKLYEGAQARFSTQTDSLLTLREEVKKEIPDISKDLAREIHQNNIDINTLRKEYFDELTEATGAVKSHLTGTQLYIIQGFKPCLVPPKGDARIGQSGVPGGFVRVLERIRSLPERRYQIKKEEIVDRYIEKLSLLHPRLTEEHVREAREKFVQIVEDVRNMSQVEFALEKEKRASEIKNIVEKKQVDVDRKITHFLLNSQIIPILEEQLSG